MPKSKVALVRCETYEYENVKASIKWGVDLLGGIDRFAKPNEKILLKPNMLSGQDPENGVTTHPAIFKAAAELFLESHAKLSFGDSPAFAKQKPTSEKTGLLKVANHLGVELADFENGTYIFYENGIQNKKYKIAYGVLNSDGVISLPKFKTHGLEKITACVKNQFGVIPGMLKAEFHLKLKNPHDLAKMLVDLDSFVNPRLYIVDGIMAMEGNGPQNGIPRKMNVILLSTDPIALDATICRMINVDPALVPTNFYGQQFGRGFYEKEKIEMVGDELSTFFTPDFDVDRKPIAHTEKKKMLNLVNSHLVQRPIINPDKCTQCGICIKVCPVKEKAVNWGASKKLPPVYDYKKCIRCFCCQELCPEGAITLNQPFLRKVLVK